MSRRVQWRQPGRAGGLGKITLPLLLVGISACLNDAPVSPRDPAFPGAPSETVSLPPGQSISIPVPPTSYVNVTSPDYVSTGITVPKGMSAHMRFTGTITATGLPACTNPAPPFEIYVNGNRFEALGNLGGAGVGWFIGPISGQGEFVNSWMFFPDVPSDSGVAVWSPDLSDRNGEIIFRRDPLNAACSGSPAYQLSGSQQVEVDFVTVDIGATKTTIQANEAVTFTAYPINFVPPDPNAVYWSFYTDANPWAPISVPSCMGQHTCTYTPPARGRMSATIPISGGSVPGFSATISIIRCPTGDLLLDGGLSDELERVLQKSLADPSKKEFKGAVWQDRATGALRFQELPSIANDPNGCWVKTNVPQSTATEMLVATYHAHPHRDGEVIVCTDPLTGAVRPPGQVNYTRWAGGSPEDWQAALALSSLEGHLVPTYVQDFTRIHKLNPVNPNPATWTSNAQHWPRCTTP
jgi:hypothetical protein